MKFRSSHLSTAISGDERHPREIAEAKGKSAPQGFPHGDIANSRFDKPMMFNPEVGALEYPDEGIVVMCQQIEADK